MLCTIFIRFICITFLNYKEIELQVWDRKIDCTSATICSLTGVKTEMNMSAMSLTIRVSVLPLHTTTTTIGGYGAEMIPIQKQAYTKTCYISRERNWPRPDIEQLCYATPSLGPWGRCCCLPAPPYWLSGHALCSKVPPAPLHKWISGPTGSYIKSVLTFIYIQISNAFLMVWLPPLWPLVLVSLKDISVPGLTLSIPRSSPHSPLHKQSQPSHLLESPHTLYKQF
jgi:hypothetical protein